MNDMRWLDLPSWRVRIFTGRKGDAADPLQQTFRWDGMAATAVEAIVAAKAAAETVWSVSATTLGRPDAPFPEVLFTKTETNSREKEALRWSIGPRFRAAIDALGTAEIHAPTPAAHAIVAGDLLTLGIRGLDAPPEALVSSRVLMNEPRARNWASLFAHAQFRGFFAYDLEPAAAEAMIALTIPRWLGARREGQYGFTDATHRVESSSTLRAGALRALRKQAPDDVAFAAKVLTEIGAAKTAARVRDLLDQATARIAKEAAST